MYLRMQHVSYVWTTIVCSKTRWYSRKHIVLCIHNKDIIVEYAHGVNMIISRSEVVHGLTEYAERLNSIQEGIWYFIYTIKTLW